MILLVCVLSIESVRDHIFSVELVEHPVCVVLHSRSKDNHFVNLIHLAKEFLRTRSNQEVASDLRVIQIVVTFPLHFDKVD